jgi:hypothetical protein
MLQTRGETVDVEQEDYVVDDIDAAVETSGLGPCIGVAIIYKNRVSLIHTAGADEASTFGSFCDEVDRVIRPADRSSIQPIVAGGEDGDFPVDAERKRAHVIAKLQGMGFGGPQIMWCPPDHVQTIIVDCARKTATVESWNYVTDANGPSVQLTF